MCTSSVEDGDVNLGPRHLTCCAKMRISPLGVANPSSKRSEALRAWSRIMRYRAFRTDEVPAMSDFIRYAFGKTSLGEVMLAASDRGAVALEFLDERTVT